MLKTPFCVAGMHDRMVHPQAARMAVSVCTLGWDVSDFSSSGEIVLMMSCLSVGHSVGIWYGPPPSTQLLNADRKLCFATSELDESVEKVCGHGVNCHGHPAA